jgi:predicted metalloprotease with PDZ domain
MKTNQLNPRHLVAILAAGGMFATPAFATDSAKPADGADKPVPNAVPATPAKETAPKNEPASTIGKAKKKSHHAKSTRTSAWLGVEVRGVAASRRFHRNPKVVIAKVTPGGPAGQAGLKAGDTLRTFDNRSMTSVRQLRRELNTLKPGTNVPVAISREGKREQFTVTLSAPQTKHIVSTKASMHHHRGLWKPAARPAHST